jgi:hypothetical protein
VAIAEPKTEPALEDVVHVLGLRVVVERPIPAVLGQGNDVHVHSRSRVRERDRLEAPPIIGEGSYGGVAPHDLD